MTVLRPSLPVIALFAVCVSAAAWPAAAASPINCADFQILGQPAREDYNPFSPGPVTKNFTVKVRRLAPGATSVRFLLFDDTPESIGPRLGPGGPALYDLQWNEDSSRRVFAFGAEGVDNVNGATVTFGNTGAGVSTTQFQLRIPRGQVAAAGLQSEELAVRYQCYSGSARLGSEAEQRGPDMRIDLRVPRYVAAYIGGVGNAHGEIAFGTLSASSGDLRKNISITALSTIPYQVAFATENGGAMTRARGAEGRIAYTMRYGGVDVASGDQIVCPTTPAPLGRSHDLEVTVDPNGIAALPAGDYGDVITLTFQPRDGQATMSGCSSR